MPRLFTSEQVAEYNKKNKTMSLETLKKRIFAVHGDTVKIKEDTYINCRTSAIFIDKDFGKFPNSELWDQNKLKK